MPKAKRWEYVEIQLEFCARTTPGPFVISHLTGNNPVAVVNEREVDVELELIYIDKVERGFGR